MYDLGSYKSTFSAIQNNPTYQENFSKYKQSVASNKNSATGVSNSLSGVDDYLSQIREANNNANQLSIQEAQKNRDWQETMSNTAHQREVADLKAAGLNPVLSANNGASTSSGSTASISDASSSMSSLLGTAINGLVAIANTQSNNATSVANNRASLDLQKELGLANLDMTKYGIDVGYSTAQNQMTNAYEIAKIQQATSSYVANIGASAQKYASDINYNNVQSQIQSDNIKQMFKYMQEITDRNGYLFNMEDIKYSNLAAFIGYADYCIQSGLYNKDNSSFMKLYDDASKMLKNWTSSSSQKSSSSGRGNSHHK